MDEPMTTTEVRVAIARGYAGATTLEDRAVWESLWQFYALTELHDLADALTPTLEQQVREVTHARA